MRQAVRLAAVAFLTIASMLSGAHVRGQVRDLQTSSIRGFGDSLEMVRDLLRRSRFTEAANVARALLARVEEKSGRDALEAAEVLDLLCEAARRRPQAGENRRLLAERAVAIKERVLGPNHPAVATSLMNVAVERTLEGDPVGARPILERAVAIRQKALGPMDPSVASSLESLAGLLMRLEDDDSAKRVIGEVVRIRETTYGADHPETLRTLSNAGIYYAVTNDFAGARTFFERVRALAEASQGTDSLLIYSSLTGLAIVAGLAGEYGEAARLDRLLLQISETALGPVHPRLRLPLDSLAQDLRDVGDYAAAKSAAEQALAISERAFGPAHAAVAKSLHTLATVLAETGDYAGAIQRLERAASIGERLNVESMDPLQDVLRSSAVTQADAQLMVSLLAFRESRYGPARPDIGDTLGDLVALLSTPEDRQRMRPLFEQAFAARKRAIGGDHPEIATIAINLANLLAQAGDDDAAEPLYQQALAIRERSLGADHPKVAAALVSLARADLRTARYDEARPLLARALDIQLRRLGPDHPDVATTLSGLAELDARGGAIAQGVETAIRAETIAREHMRLTTRTLAEHQAMAYATGRTSTLDLLLTLAAGHPDDREAARAAWDAVIRARGLVLEEMASRHRSTIASENQEIEQLAAALTSARQQLAAAVVRGIRDEPPERYHRLLEQARSEKNRAERALAERSARFRQDESRSRFGFRDVVAALPAGAALVAFVRYHQLDLSRPRVRTGAHAAVPAYLAFLLQPGGHDPVVVPLGDAATIDTSIGQWRRQLELESMAGAGRSGEGAYRRVAGALRQRVWDPLAGQLSNARRVLLVPDGAFHLVSFAALPTGDSRFLVETAPLIHYMSSERDLAPAETGRPAGEGLLAVGSPAFDERPPASNTGSGAAAGGSRSACRDFQAMRFGPLPASLKEVDRVVALWDQSHRPANGRLLPDSGEPSRPESTRLTGAQASESAFKAEAGGRRVLHAATHGFFLGGGCGSTKDRSGAAMSLAAPAAVASENPLLLSGLILAGANQREAAEPGGDDGILTAEEIVSLDLDGVEWAVLSACDTGVGEVKPGEGVFGLRRAFQIAGVRTVIMSLWSVEDRATRDWMTALYRQRFLERRATIDAVHAASLDLLRQRRAAGLSTHPFYWAGFIAAGDWR